MKLRSWIFGSNLIGVMTLSMIGLCFVSSSPAISETSTWNVQTGRPTSKPSPKPKKIKPRSTVRQKPRPKPQAEQPTRPTQPAASQDTDRPTRTIPPATVQDGGVRRIFRRRPSPMITNWVGIEFVWVPSGSFRMGSENGEADEKPVHQVTIREGFYMGKYEVTQQQWQKVMGTNPSYFKDDNLPVEAVSWNDAQEFVRQLNVKNDGYLYRLPSEAEWEYAARAGTTGDHAGALDAIGWYANNSGRDKGGRTHPVGSKLPNAFGLFDMHGNVLEWCQDWYHDNYEGAPTDGSAWVTGGEQNYRVLRGGSWQHDANASRSAVRRKLPPRVRFRYDGGFRIVAIVNPHSASGKTNPKIDAISKTTPTQQEKPKIDAVLTKPLARPPQLRNRAGIEFIWIPPGSFIMGSTNGEADELPLHRVKFSEGFYMGKYEVTIADWRAVMGDIPERMKGLDAKFKENERQPVVLFTGEEMEDFIRRLNAQDDGYTYRLPTEAQWEYAARANTTGDYAGDVDAMAWYANNSGRARLDATEMWRTDSQNYYSRIIENGGRTHPVGTKQPNAFGLFDMHGNVWEICEDWYHRSYEGAPTDGSAWMIGGEQQRGVPPVLRGGSWINHARDSRSAYRGRNYIGSRIGTRGLRLVAIARQ